MTNAFLTRAQLLIAMENYELENKNQEGKMFSAAQWYGGLAKLRKCMLLTHSREDLHLVPTP